MAINLSRTHKSSHPDVFCKEGPLKIFFKKTIYIEHVRLLLLKMVNIKVNSQAMSLRTTNIIIDYGKKKFVIKDEKINSSYQNIHLIKVIRKFERVFSKYKGVFCDSAFYHNSFLTFIQVYKRVKILGVNDNLVFLPDSASFPANICLLKISDRNTRKRCEIRTGETWALKLPWPLTFVRSKKTKGKQRKKDKSFKAETTKKGLSVNVLAILELLECKNFSFRPTTGAQQYFSVHNGPSNLKSISTTLEICSKLTIKTPETTLLTSFWCFYC